MDDPKIAPLKIKTVHDLQYLFYRERHEAGAYQESLEAPFSDAHS